MNLTRLIHIALTIALTLPGCDEDTHATDAGPNSRTLSVIKPYGPDVGLRPGAEAQLQVRYASATGAIIAGSQVRFAIFGDPSGSTLSFDRVDTDTRGVAAITVRAGAGSSRFRVTASAPGAADASFYIEVSDKGFGSISVSARYSGALPRIQLTATTHLLLPGGSCAGLDPLSPSGVLRVRTATKLQDPVLFTAIALGSARAVLTRAATTDGRARASGCVEVPGSVLKADRVLSLAIQLKDLQPRIQGSYQLETVVVIPGGGGSPAWPRPMADALAPWSDLSDCKRDPAQALLDCVVDAMDSTDPLDCVVANPSAQAAAIQAERGALSAGCRGIHTVRVTPSLEKLVHARMELNGKTTLAALATIPQAAQTQLARITLGSTLTLTPLSSGGNAVARHQLDSVAVGQIGAAVTFKVSEIGLVNWSANAVEASVNNTWTLKLARHQLSLRPGLLAREALSRGVLKPAKLAGDAPALVAQLLALLQISSGGKELKGCDALQSMVCNAARLPPTCLGNACQLGATALATRLDSGFTSMDKHAAADLTLSGEVGLKDEDGDLKIDGLGSATLPGIWDLRLAMGDDLVTPGEAKFTGKPTSATAP